MDKIAIVRRNGLGDLLCAIPLYRYLQKKYPKAQITFFVDEKNAALFNYFPEKINRVIFPKKRNKYFNHIFFGFKWRKERFDLAISAKTSPMKMMTFFLFCLGAKKRIAVTDGKWHRRLLTHPIPSNEGLHPHGCVHQSLKSVQMLDPLFTEIPEAFFPRLMVPEEISKKYTSLITLKGPYLLLSATTTKEPSRMEEEKYARIVNRLHVERPFSVIIIGQENDRKRMETISAHLKVPFEIHFPRNFEEFMVILNQADLYFVGDGGIAHIGSALQKHEVVFFGVTRPLEWGPLSQRVMTFYNPRNVNFLIEEKLLSALKKQYDEVMKWKK